MWFLNNYNELFYVWLVNVEDVIVNVLFVNKRWLLRKNKYYV